MLVGWLADKNRCRQLQKRKENTNKRKTRERGHARAAILDDELHL
jgi:hypothetical protein